MAYIDELLRKINTLSTQLVKIYCKVAASHELFVICECFIDVSKQRANR